MTLPVDRPQVLDALDKLMVRDDDLGLILSQIPTMFGTSEKATYLGFRATGLNSEEALMVLELTEEDRQRWVNEQPQFELFENELLPELQQRVGPEIIRLAFLRNQTLYMMLDTNIVRKAHKGGISKLGDKEFAYLRTARRNYTPRNMMDMQRALDPNRPADNVITINIGNQGMYEIVEGEVTVARSDDQPIEGEVVEQ